MHTFPICNICRFYPCMCGERQYVEEEELRDPFTDGIEEEKKRLQRQIDLLEKRTKE